MYKKTSSYFILNEITRDTNVNVWKMATEKLEIQTNKFHSTR